MYVNTIQVVFEHGLEESLIFKIGGITEALLSHGYNVRQINVPETAPPEAPRITAQIDNNFVNFSLSRTEYIINVPQHINKDIGLIYNYFISVVKNTHSLLKIDERGYQWCGVIVPSIHEVNADSLYPDVMYPLFKKLINISIEKDALSALSLQCGYYDKDTGLYKNFEISGYELLEFNVKVPSKTTVIRISAEESKAIERGFNITIDINNKKKTEAASSLEEFIWICEESKKTLEQAYEILNIGGIFHE